MRPGRLPRSAVTRWALSKGSQIDSSTTGAGRAKRDPVEEFRAQPVKRATATLPRVLIVDDESAARRYLRELLEGDSQVQVVGESANGVQGAAQILELSPDIVFVDIQMPGLDGFGMLEQIAGGRAPLFVFVTGYSEYAVKAFEIEAVDYVCKPFDRDRLLVAVERALRRLSSTGQANGERAWLSRLSIRNEERIEFLPVADIVWIEAANKYVLIHTATQSHILRQTIQSLEDALDPREFVRTHRSTLVRKAAVRGLHPLFHGDYIVKLTNGAEVTLSRSFRGAFFREMSR
jgi:two-component system, LytTR family, response regulator